MNADDVRALLRRACAREGGMRAWARKNKTTAQYVSLVLAGDREPGEAIFKALKVERVVTYRKTK